MKGYIQTDCPRIINPVLWKSLPVNIQCRAERLGQCRSYTMCQAKMRTASARVVRWCTAMLQAVQQVVEDRLMSLREDMQASQQQVTGQFAQHQVWHHIMHTEH